VVASSSHLKPGEKGKIDAKINISGRTGYISKSIRVFSNDPKKPEVSLTLKALIQ
jgi:Protein of unknown function (DUF1573)